MLPRQGLHCICVHILYACDTEPRVIRRQSKIHWLEISRNVPQLMSLYPDLTHVRHTRHAAGAGGVIVILAISYECSRVRYFFFLYKIFLDAMTHGAQKCKARFD